jgi:hypothetical protein
MTVETGSFLATFAPVVILLLALVVGVLLFRWATR